MSAPHEQIQHQGARPRSTATSKASDRSVRPTRTNSTPRGKTKIKGNVKGVGQECPTHTSKFNIKGKTKINGNVKGVGQECPTHTNKFNTKGKTKINDNVKGVGQECPTHTSLLRYMPLGR